MRCNVVLNKFLSISCLSSNFLNMQALFVFLLLPFLSNLRGIQFGDLPAYINDGASCFLNTGDDQAGKFNNHQVTVLILSFCALVHP
jgi:hypothetical protein